MSEGQNGEVKLLFSSRFHMEKVNLTENRAKVEKAITHIFGKIVKLTCVFDSTATAPKSEPTPPNKEKSIPVKSTEQAKKTLNLAEKAMEMFEEDS